ncbi:MAG: molybdate ABC transporter substrate-binding protein [Pseudomonadota bacterium]
MLPPSCVATAEQANLAVASNFQPAMEELAQDFEALSEHDLIISSGATGTLYSQIRFGAPFDVFLSADTAHPQRLLDEGRAQSGSEITYAIGRLVMWSRSLSDLSVTKLQDPDVDRIAIATPMGAPYGIAANQVFEHFELVDDVRDRLVFGESIGQAFAFAHSGNADIALVSASLVLQLPEDEVGYSWPIPVDAHSPITQQAVVLRTGAENTAAIDFMAYLKSPRAQDIIRKYGYDTP